MTMLNPKMRQFFDNRGDTAVTFNDVLLLPDYADFLPDAADLSTRFSRNVPLKLPLVSAAMDTVTEARMAIAIAKAGGIGSIHRNLEPDVQAHAVGEVKNHIHGLIAKPVTASPDETVGSLTERKEGHRNWNFESFPVVTPEHVLVGLMTRRNFKTHRDPTTLIRDAMVPFDKLVVGTPGMDKQQAYEMLRDTDKSVLPLVDSDRRLVGMYALADLERILGNETAHNVDFHGRLRVGAAVGVGEKALYRASLLVPKGVDFLHLDTAHGYTKAVVDTIKALKKQHPATDVVAGNITRAEAALALAQAGADGILVGQGGGSICTTRPVTGTGRPQVTAVAKCVFALRDAGIDVPICSDGGISKLGDLAIALAVGASSVMVGRLLAGTDETPGDVNTDENGRVMKTYRGMGSLGALRTSAASRERYSQSSKGALIPEGVEGKVPAVGPVDEILEQCGGALRKSMGYVGARTIDQLWRKAELELVTNAGVEESHVHNLASFERPRNYSGRS